MSSTVSIKRLTCARIPTDFGQFQLCYYENSIDNKEHLALIMGNVHDSDDVLVRIHSECFTGDVLGSRRCDCGEQLQQAMQMIAAEGQGVILYLRQEGRGIGLLEKLRAYNLQDDGYDTVDANLMLGHEADERDYTIGALMLNDLGIDSIRLITNNPTKIDSVNSFGIAVSQRVPLQPTQLTNDNIIYLQTKITRMRHLLDGQQLVESTNGSASHPNPVPSEKHAQQLYGELSKIYQDAIDSAQPLITLSYAQTIDGAITTSRGRPYPISNKITHKMTHALRALNSGILVGIGTVLADDPRLNVRLVSGHNPTPIVLDSALRTPPTAKLLQDAPYPIIATSKEAPSDKQIALEAAGATIIRLPSIGPGLLSLEHLLTEMALRQIYTIMVEGGGQVIQSFLEAGLANIAVITVSLRFMGGYPAIGRRIGEAPIRLHTPKQMMMGDDLVIWGKFQG